MCDRLLAIASSLSLPRIWTVKAGETAWRNPQVAYVSRGPCRRPTHPVFCSSSWAAQPRILHVCHRCPNQEALAGAVHAHLLPPYVWEMRFSGPAKASTRKKSVVSNQSGPVVPTDSQQHVQEVPLRKLLASCDQAANKDHL